MDSFKEELNSRVLGLRLSKWHHAANISCVVKQLLLTSNYFTSVRILVKHPPSMLKIYLQNEKKTISTLSWEEYLQSFDSIKTNTTISLIDGTFYRFACSTNLHYTILNINWSLSLNDNEKEQYNLENSRHSQIIVGQFFRQTNSYVELKATREIINMNLICTAWPVDSVILSASLKIKIFYSPEKPSLTGYTHAEAINEYETISLLCTSKSGYPLPDLIWYKENATLSNAEPIVSNEDKISSLLSFKVSREDNGKLINCAARNVATTNFGVYSNSIAIRVIFPARHVKVKSVPFQFKQILENSIIVLTCETDSSNPASDIQWWLIRCSFSDNRKLVKRQVPCSKSTLKEIHREVVAGSYQGWKTISKLKYLAKWIDNENFIECESKLQNSESTVSSLHYDRLRLNIIFSPHFSSRLSNGSIFQSQENSDLVINLKATGNPGNIRYTWLHNNEALENNSTFQIAKHILTIAKITRTNMGSYSLIAENDIGRNEIRFRVDVTYHPVISGEKSSQVYVKFNRNVSVTCEISGNPYLQKYFKWIALYPRDMLSPIKEGREWISGDTQNCSQLVTGELFPNGSWKPLSTVQCTTPRKFSMISNYHLINSSYFNNVVLQCFYDNRIFSPALKNFIFYIESQPQYQVVRQFAFQGVENREAATFTCIFKGYPIKSVEWHNCTSMDHSYMDLINNRSTGSPVTNATLLSETTDLYEIQPNLYRADNKIWHHDWRMLSKICCQAANSFGSDMGLIEVVFKSKPHPPINLRCLEIFPTTLLIKWDQGFDGGTDQTFRIKIVMQDKIDETIQFDIAGNKYRNSIFYNISGLIYSTCYVIRVGAFNRLFLEMSFAEPLTVCTLSDPNSLMNHQVEANIKSNVTNVNSSGPTIRFEGLEKSTSFIVTVAGCVFGFIIFIINVLTFVICYKKKKERVRKRRQSKELQSTDERQTENLSKLDSSMIENHLYDGSILAGSDSCYVPEHRDKEEEIPMLMYQKPICPLHFVPNDQYSNPLIIQDHYLQSAISCSQTNSKIENNCFGCTSIELPLNNMILSNQYLQFPLIKSSYNSIMRSSCDYSTNHPNVNPVSCSEFRNFSNEIDRESQTFFDEDISHSLPKIPISLQALHLSHMKQIEDPYQNMICEQNVPRDMLTVQSPIIRPGFSRESE